VLRGGLLFLFALSTVWASAQVPFKHRFAPQQGLTLPVERPFREEICLNGSWQFQPVPPSRPPQSINPPSTQWEKVPIRIPSPWNVNAFPTESKQGGDFRTYPSYPEAWEKVEAGWLRRSFDVPKSWEGKRTILRFQAVAGDTDVFVNGKAVAHHFDNFLPFEIDVTEAVRLGEKNELLVGVRKASLFDVQGQYGRRTYQGGSMWGQTIAGIWQDVYLTAVPAVRITDVFVRPDLENDVLSATVTVRNDTDKPAVVSLDGLVKPWINQAGQDMISAPEPKWTLGPDVLAMKPEKQNIPAHSEILVSVQAKASGRIKPWSSEHPNLNGLICRLNGATKDVKYTRFGWRQITFRGTKVLLNGKPLIMKGDSWHFMGIPQMTRRYAWAWFKALRDANLNAVRLHAQPYPSFYLDVADEQGILVLDETAVWASDGGPKLDDPSYWTDTQRHLRELIHRDRNHPSVFGWSVSNEVMAVVRNVFHAPKEVEDQANRMNGIWAAICREEDPTRNWISADGEEDGHGALPVSVIHYGDRSTMDRANKAGKPWGVGEAGPAYYGSPKQIAEMSGNPRSYLSFEDRMEGVAAVSYRSLMDQRDEGGSYRSVFNLVWYGLKPLGLGMHDTSRPPRLTDGIMFTAFREGQPGVQPERLGPYCSTLNPGYDPGLPLYEPWPLFEAIRNAQAEPPIPFVPKHSFVLAPPNWPSPKPVIAAVLSGGKQPFVFSLNALGVQVSEEGDLLLVDGVNPPGAEAKARIDSLLGKGGTVLFWGARTETLSALNALLPRPIELTGRMASSLVATSDPATAGLTPESLYFSELSPSTVLSHGIGGPILEGAKVLLSACDTDWKRWNNQGETVKTAMVLRSEREAKPSGAALVELKIGPGRLLVCSLDIVPGTSQAKALNQTILRNLGLQLGSGLESQNLLGADGNLRGALRMEAPSSFELSPNSGKRMVEGAVEDGHAWRRWAAGESAAFTGYFSFWLYSPKSLDNLLLDPHLPKVSLELPSATGYKVWVNGKVSDASLPLVEGWNHVLVKAEGKGQNLALKSTQPEFLKQLRATFEAPK